MQDPTLQTIIDTFFTCNRAELLEIFQELLTALQADGVHPRPDGRTEMKVIASRKWYEVATPLRALAA